jgi:hypothetical protein
MKSEEDFRHSRVVTKLFQSFVWIVVVVLNLGMILFTMLRGLQRGYDWQVRLMISLSRRLYSNSVEQKAYLFACILQFIVEICFYETTECLLMSFLIPDLVRSEVLSVGFSLRQTVQKVCSGVSSNSKSTSSLDAPSYLFLSTSVERCLSFSDLISSSHPFLFRNVANYFPQTLASLIVLSYHTPSPGELAHKWKSTPNSFVTNLFHWTHHDHRQRRRQYTLTAFVLFLFQQIGSLAPGVQRLIVHIIQPMVFGGLILVGVMMMRYPLSFLGFAGLLLLLLGSVARSVWNEWREKQENESLEAEEELRNRELERDVGKKLEEEKCGDVVEGKGLGQNVERAPSSSDLNRSPRGRAYSEDILESEGDGDRDSSSISSSRQRFSSSDRFDSPTHYRSNSIDSSDSSSLPYRRRTSSADSFDPTCIWRNVSQPTEFFNNLIIDEEELEESVESHEGISTSGSSQNQDEGEDEEIEQVIIVPRKMNS